MNRKYDTVKKSFAGLCLMSGLLLTQSPAFSTSTPTTTTFTLNTGVPGVTTGTMTGIASSLTSTSDLSNGGTSRSFAAQSFTPSATGSYTFGVGSSVDDTVLVVYGGPFTPSSAGTNALDIDDDDGGFAPSGPGSTVTISGCGGSASLCPQLTATLNAGTTYTVVVTTYSQSSNSLVPVSFYVYGEPVSVGGAPANGVCGTAANTAVSILPSSNLCTAGTAGQVSSSQGQYGWTCSGTGGGTNASCAAPWATNAGTGSGSLSASGNGWAVSSASFAATPTATPPAGVTFPNGLLDLRLTTGTSGTDATVVVQYTTAVPAGAVYMKYGKTAANQTDHWYELPASRAVFSQDRMSVTLTLTDGGAGDNDLLANGTIVDPGGPALVAAPAAIPTLSEWAMILMASLMGLFAFTRIRRQS